MNLKNNIIIKIACILLLSGLIIAIVIHSKSMSEERCIVRFITNIQRGVQLDTPNVIEIDVITLYNKTIENNCVIKWDSNIGYFKDG